MANKNTKTPVMVLHELTVRRKIAPPVYEIIINYSGTHQNRFDYKVSVAGIKAHGTGSSKQVSKHQAAHNALQMLKELGEYNPVEDSVGEFSVALQENGSQPNSFLSKLDCVGPLMTVCVENKIPPPIFKEISDVGPPHAREFTYECKIASIITEAKGSTKKMAKQLAAKEMLDRIKDIIPQLSCPDRDNRGENREGFDKQVIIRYNEIREFFPDKGIKLEDYHLTLRKLMDERNLKYTDFADDLREKNSDSFKRICEKLELNCDIFCLQNDPTMVALSLSMDSPFCVMGVSTSEAKASEMAMQEAFNMMEFLMKVTS